MGTILTAAIRVADQSLAWSFSYHCSEQRLHYQVLRHAHIQGIADPFAVEQVFDTSKIQPAFVGSDVGNIRCTPFFPAYLTPIEAGYTAAVVLG